MFYIFFSNFKYFLFNVTETKNNGSLIRSQTKK